MTRRLPKETVDGKMIDVPVIDRARQLLKREATVTAREAKMREHASNAS